MASSGSSPLTRGKPRDTAFGPFFGGSSPLTRGKHHQEAQRADQDRFIPTHAGKTTPRSPRYGTSRAHPRSCEENVRLPSVLRGAGLIPAHTGKTSLGCVATRRRRAHPHSREENYAPASSRAFWIGSSPLTRRKRFDLFPRRVHGGFIPTHVGKTRRERPARWLTAAHPRSCGENRVNAENATVPVGSSPLTRGKPDGRLPQNYQAGLIPAHAGKTVKVGGIAVEPGAHPRSCGENAMSQGQITAEEGSSPRGRGKRCGSVERC